MAAASSPYGVFTNSGTAWSSAGIPFGGPVACSGDGSTLVVGVANGPIYSLGNAGQNWTSNSAPVTNWTGIASSWDGTRMLASVGGGNVYTFPARPLLTLSNSGSSISLLWPTNAIGFGLEQNSNLTTGAWIAVTNVPTVTSTQYQVILDPTNGNSFYRLLNP